MTKPHILIFYINVGNNPRSRVHQIMGSVKAMMDRDKPEGWIYHYLPVQTETRVECVNPQVISEKEYGETKSEIDMMNNRVADYLKKMNNENE